MPMPSKRKWPADPYQTTAPGAVSAPSGYQTRTTGTAANDATARTSVASAGGATVDSRLQPKPGDDAWDPPIDVPVGGVGPGPGGGAWAGHGPVGGGLPTGTGGDSRGFGAGASDALTGQDGYESPTGGLYGYYQNRVGSKGMADDVKGAYFQDTALPVEAQAKQAEEAMLRVRAATGNDAGLYAGVAENQKTATEAQGDMTRKNLLTQAQIAREDQREGSAGLANLYGQQQAQTMEYLRMLGNLLGRQRSTASTGSSGGVEGGIQYTPGM